MATILFADPWKINDKRDKRVRRLIRQQKERELAEKKTGIKVRCGAESSNIWKNDKLLKKVLLSTTGKPMYRVCDAIQGCECPECGSKRIGWLICDVYPAGLPEHIIERKPELAAYKNKEYRKMYPEETFSICTDCGDVLYIEDYNDCDEG